MKKLMLLCLFLVAFLLVGCKEEKICYTATRMIVSAAALYKEGDIEGWEREKAEIRRGFECGAGIIEAIEDSIYVE